MTEAQDLIEYLAQIMPGVMVECAGCGIWRAARVAVLRDEKLYCSDGCADRSCALLRKPQPDRVDCDGWSI